MFMFVSTVKFEFVKQCRCAWHTQLYRQALMQTNIISRQTTLLFIFRKRLLRLNIACLYTFYPIKYNSQKQHVIQIYHDIILCVSPLLIYYVKRNQYYTNPSTSKFTSYTKPKHWIFRRVYFDLRCMMLQYNEVELCHRGM